MAFVFRGLQEFTKLGATVLFTHHHRKQYGYPGASNPAQNMRGSSDILAAVDGHFSVEKKSDENMLILRHNKSRQSEPMESFEVSIVKDEQGNVDFVYKGQHDEAKSKAEKAAEAIITILKDGPKSRGEIEEALAANFGKGAVNEGIKIALKTDQIELVPKDELSPELAAHSRRKYYRLCVGENPNSP